MATLLTFSDLPDTVILDIMEYLSPIDVYRAMHGINNRLDNIIRYGTTRINLSNIESKQDFDYHMEHILPDVTTSLRFLKAANNFLFDQEQGHSDSRQRPVMFGIIKKVQAKLKLATYEKLEELSLKNVNGTQLKLISDEIGNMFQLKRLTISFYGTTADFCASLLSNAVIRSKLTTLDLFLTDANASFPNIPSTHILPNLDHLTVNACIIGNAAVLCRMVPNIKYLSICIWNFPNQRPTNSTETFILTNLTYLKLKLDEVRWNFAENFLKQCGQNVKHLTFKASDDFVFIDATKWENLMTNHMKN
ncbi:hypothetical protein I4U23_020077 [Adineta vaga]|nr:hypothetical protein I4U23_020077 [Adineta vaga]